MLLRCLLLLVLSLSLVQASTADDARRRRRQAINLKPGPSPMDLMGPPTGSQSFLDLQSLIKPAGSTAQSSPDGVSPASSAPAPEPYPVPNHPREKPSEPEPQKPASTGRPRPRPPGRQRFERPPGRPARGHTAAKKNDNTGSITGRVGEYGGGADVPDGYATSEEYELAQGSSWGNDPSKSHKWATPEETGDGYWQPEPLKDSLWAMPAGNAHKWAMKAADEPLGLKNQMNSNGEVADPSVWSSNRLWSKHLQMMSQMMPQWGMDRVHKWQNNRMFHGMQASAAMAGMNMQHLQNGLQKGRPMMNGMQMQGNTMGMYGLGVMNGKPMPGAAQNMQRPDHMKGMNIPGIGANLNIPHAMNGMYTPGGERPGQMNGMPMPGHAQNMQRPGQMNGMYMSGNPAHPQNPGMPTPGNPANMHRPWAMNGMYMPGNAASMQRLGGQSPGSIRGNPTAGGMDRYAAQMANAMRHRQTPSVPTGMKGKP